MGESAARSSVEPTGQSVLTGQVVFLLAHVPQCGIEWMPEMPFAECAAELLAAGVRAQVIQIEVDPADAEQSQRDEDALIAHLVSAGTAIVVFDQLPLAHMSRRLHAEVGALLLDTDPWGGLRDSPPDYLVHDLYMHRRVLTELCLRLVRGDAVDDVPNVEVWTDAGLRPTRAGRVPVCATPAGDYVPRRDHVFFPADFRPIARRRALQSSTGCPFTLDFRRNPEFTGVDVPPHLATAGCTFCSLGGRYHSLDNEASVRFLVDRIQAIRALEPGVDEIFLSDQLPLRYIEALVRALAGRGLLPLRLMLSARADWIVQRAEALTRATAQMSAAGGALGMYLCGFETFSPHLAAVYNKSATPENWGDTCRAAIDLLYDLRHKYGEAFVIHPGAASFIVMSPWTTLEDLRIDADAIESLGIGALSAEAPFSELRLYDNVPLTAKARAQGLLIGDDHEHSAMGYAQMVSWRFADARAERVHDLLSALRPGLAPEEWPGLLKAAVALVERESATAASALPIDSIRRHLEEILEMRAMAPDIDGDTRLVEVARGCNNGCHGCIGRQVLPADEDAERIAANILDGGAIPHRLLLGGHEPTLLPDLPRLLALLRAGDVPEIGILSNGRRFAVPAYARACVRAGLDRALIKWAGPGATTHDEFSQVSGAFGQMRNGFDNLRRAATEQGTPLRTEMLAVVHAGNIDALPQAVDAALALGATALRVRVAIGGLDLGRLDATAAGLEALLRRAIPAGLVTALG